MTTPSKPRVVWGVLAAILVGHVALAALVFDPKPFIGGDNASYMILAEALETGEGYRDLYLPDSPRHAKYPPLYPVVLAIARLFGGELIAFKLLSLLFTTTAIALLFLLASRRLGEIGGLAVAAAFAFNPVLVYYSHWVLSEAPFVALTLAGLWAAERMEGSPRWLVGAAVAALLAYLTRSAGLPLVAALLIALARRKSWRPLAAVGGAALLVIGGWWLWGKLTPATAEKAYASEFLLLDPYNPELGYAGPGALIARIVNNIRLYVIDVLPESLAGVAPAGGVNPLALVAALVIVALAVVAWGLEIRKLRPLEAFVLLYAGLILMWPQVWSDRRFLLPLLPVLLLLAGAGVIWCFDFLRAKRPTWALPAVAGLLVLLAVPDHVRSVGFNQQCMRSYRQGDRLACYPPPWRAFAEAGEWMSQNTPEDAIVVSRKPRLFYYFGRRRGDVYPFTTDAPQIFAFLDRIDADYVVVAALSATTYRFLVPAIRAMPERFSPVHQVGEGPVAAYVLAYRARAPARPGGEQNP